jgi:hypothetical protein
VVLSLLLIAVGIAVDQYVKGFGPRARQRVIAALEQRFDADVQLKSVQVSLYPRPNVTGEGVTIRHKQWPDRDPLISIRRFSAQTDFSTLINRRNHLDLVRLEGLQIRVPPRGSAAQHELTVDNEQVASAEPGHDTTRFQFYIEKMIADGATLEIEPKMEGKRPLHYDIQKLSLRSIGAGQPMAFEAKLTNAKPPGLIDSSGSFGPWQKDDPRATPVSGKYTFQNADLGVFKGISGTLASTGSYHGVLQHIEVDGSTDTPNFALKRGGQPVHLATVFHSIVNGTDGDTLLDPVDARFLHSEFVCKGGVVHVDGTPGKTVKLDAFTRQARMEDVLRLVTGDSRPFVRGDVDFRAKIVIPQGPQDVLDKLDLDGTFRLLSSEFTSQEVQQRLTTLSARARGISKQEEQQMPPMKVASDLDGRFKLDNALVSFSSLSFDVPGAAIHLAGTYNLRSEAIDMNGTFRMQATLSETQSGVKHLLLKPLDPFFKKDGAGFEVPIKLTGTRSHPEIGATVFHHQFTIH